MNSTDIKSLKTEKKGAIKETLSFGLWLLLGLFIATRLVGTARVIGTR